MCLVRTHCKEDSQPGTAAVLGLDIAVQPNRHTAIALAIAIAIAIAIALGNRQ